MLVTGQVAPPRFCLTSRVKLCGVSQLPNGGGVMPLSVEELDIGISYALHHDIGKL